MHLLARFAMYLLAGLGMSELIRLQTNHTVMDSLKRLKALHQRWCKAFRRLNVARLRQGDSPRPPSFQFSDDWTPLRYLRSLLRDSLRTYVTANHGWLAPHAGLYQTHAAKA